MDCNSGHEGEKSSNYYLFNDPGQLPGLIMQIASYWDDMHGRTNNNKAKTSLCL